MIRALLFICLAVVSMLQSASAVRQNGVNPVTPPSNGDAVAKTHIVVRIARMVSTDSRMSTASSASPRSLSSVERLKASTLGA